MKYYQSHKKKHADVYSNLQEKWHEFEQRYWRKHPSEKYCHACGSKRHVELHHIVPRHIDSSKIFDESNLIPLCRCCHFRIGHLLDWDNYNPNVRKDAANFLALIKARRKEVR